MSSEQHSTTHEYVDRTTVIDLLITEAENQYRGALEEESKAAGNINAVNMGKMISAVLTKLGAQIAGLQIVQVHETVFNNNTAGVDPSPVVAVEDSFDF